MRGLDSLLGDDHDDGEESLGPRKSEVRISLFHVLLFTSERERMLVTFETKTTTDFALMMKMMTAVGAWLPSHSLNSLL